MVGFFGCFSNQHRGRQWTPWLILRPNALPLFLLLLTMVTAGCRSRAYQQVYNDKMAGEIRRLEDSLYAAEYENEVLQQQLERQQQRFETPKQREGNFGRNERQKSGESLRDDESGVGSGNRFGDSLPPAKPLPDRRDNFDDPLGDDLDIDLGDPPDGGTLMPPPSLNLRTPPPINPVPPRESDLIPPAIDLGEPLPPGSNNGTVPKPPGQIEMPGEVRQLFPGSPLIASAVEVHLGLSGVHHADNDASADGVYLVVSVKDPDGNPFESDKPISIVLLDPARSGEDARLGRWDLSIEQVREKYKTSPLNSYHIPLNWIDKKPLGTDVAVFVRVLVDSETKLETNTMLPLADSNGASAKWIPNSFGRQLATPGFDTNSVWR